MIGRGIEARSGWRERETATGEPSRVSTRFQVLIICYLARDGNPSGVGREPGCIPHFVRSAIAFVASAEDCTSTRSATPAAQFGQILQTFSRRRSFAPERNGWLI
jgi:hypothetical protein